jgi:chromosome condensin MukBEF ATPase and DNA-binding subunit MukB
MALNTLIELDELEKSDAEVRIRATQKALHALERAEALSGNPDMTVAEAENYLKALARGGNVEAQKLLEAFADPFLDLG